MQLQFKPKLDETLEAWCNFWTGANQRPMILATSTRPGVKVVEAPPYLTAFDCDFRDLARHLLAWAETHEFLGDSLPYYYLEFGPETFAA